MLRENRALDLAFTFSFQFMDLLEHYLRWVEF